MFESILWNVKIHIMGGYLNSFLVERECLNPFLGTVMAKVLDSSLEVNDVELQ